MRKFTPPFRPLASKVCVVAAVALVISSLTSFDAQAGTVATGDSRSVHQPTLPAICQPRAANLATGGGTVSTVTYVDTCETGVAHLIELNPRYSSSSGSGIPEFTDILVNGLTAVSSASGAQSIIEGYDSSHVTGLTLQYVNLDQTAYTAAYANVGVYSSNLSPASGTGVTLTKFTSPVTGGSVPTCSFLGYPNL